MLLMKLENKEKFAFLELAHHLALIDGEFSKKEKALIEEFCAQMGIEDEHFEDEDFDLKELLSYFGSMQSKKVVILALMMLVHIDDKFDLHEYQLILEIAEVFNLSKSEVELYSSWGKSVTGMYNQARLFIEN